MIAAWWWDDGGPYACPKDDPRGPAQFRDDGVEYVIGVKRVF